MQFNSRNLKEGIYQLRKALFKAGKTVKTKKWQSEDSPATFHELLFVSLISPMGKTIGECSELTNATPKWAEDHFQERVSGKPLNPPPSHIDWSSKAIDYANDGLFSHTYPERMWPKTIMPDLGIRFKNSDLKSAVEVLKSDEHTRQCYVPIWFPEDLEASLSGERVPCTLGWHFIVRDGKMNCLYPIRSCDAIRHFHNDLYLANRLVIWMIEQSGIDCEPGYINFTCSSFHCFKNDLYALEKEIKNYDNQYRGS